MNSAICTIKRTSEDQHKPILKSAVYVIKKEYQTNHHRLSLTNVDEKENKTVIQAQYELLLSANQKKDTK